MTGPVPLRCHRCNSADLILYESHVEHHEYDGGLVVNERGEIEARGKATHSPGEILPQKTRIRCDGCGHEWHPRRHFAGVELAPGGQPWATRRSA